MRVDLAYGRGRLPVEVPDDALTALHQAARQQRRDPLEHLLVVETRATHGDHD